MAFPADFSTLESGVAANCPTPEFLIALGVTGGIAAYKSLELIRLLKKQGAEVIVIPTPAALSFIGEKSWEAISGNPVYKDFSTTAGSAQHIAIGKRAAALVIAPLTANTMAKIAAGISDNPLTATVLSATCPVLLAPAMHSEMWNNSATAANFQTLRQRGFYFSGPATGELAGGDKGIGRMANPAVICQDLAEILRNQNRAASMPHNLPLAGKKVCISGGGTVEAIDPVRYISNRSSGRMAVEIARAAQAAGATTTLVAAHIDRGVEADIPRGVKVISALSAAEMAKIMPQESAQADIVIMAAAVADYRVAQPQNEKIKRDNEKIILEMLPNPDILQKLVENRSAGQIVLGFAAETGDKDTPYLQYGAEKAKKKGADFLAVNLVGENIGFGEVESCITLFTKDGKEVASYQGAKSHIAHELIYFLSQKLSA